MQLYFASYKEGFSGGSDGKESAPPTSYRILADL